MLTFSLASEAKLWVGGLGARAARLAPGSGGEGIGKTGSASIGESTSISLSTLRGLVDCARFTSALPSRCSPPTLARPASEDPLTTIVRGSAASMRTGGGGGGGSSAVAARSCSSYHAKKTADISCIAQGPITKCAQTRHGCGSGVMHWKRGQRGRAEQGVCHSV